MIFKYEQIKITIFFTGLFLIFAVPKNLCAENQWIKYESSTGLFEVNIPNEYETNNTTFNNSDNTFVQAGEIISTIDQRPYKNAVKNYIIKYDQTIAGNLSNEEMTEIVQREMAFYKDYYKELGGTVVEEKITPKRYGPGGELYMTYKDSNLGLQGIKVYVHFAGSTKYQQIATGIDRSMSSRETQSFFSSFKPSPGVAVSKYGFQESWQKHVPPSEVFSILLPPTSHVYTPEPPSVKAKGDTESISFVFADPVRKQSLFYKTYSHRFSENLTFATAKEALIERHVSKHLKTLRNLHITRGQTDDNIPTLEAEYAVGAPKGHPYITTVKLRALFLGNYMMVQEIIGSSLFVHSNFAKTLPTLTEFTPKRAYEHDKKAAELKNDVQPETKEPSE